MSDQLLAEIQEAIRSHPVVLFTKGTKDMPMCGFSRRTIGIFQEIGRPFETVDVLADPQMRHVLSAHSNWPTIPQVFIGGQFIGGCDIVTEMHEKGELEPLVEAAFEGK
jgi:monothiol glutaredoxin